jgi:hypothetical protein
MTWDDILMTNKIYPDNSISILMLKTESGKAGTGWVNKGYEDYLYKEYCAYNFLIMVDLTDDIAKNNPELDMGTIEDYFVNELRKICVAHIVARLVTDTGMNIEMYIDKHELAMEQLQTLLDNPNRLVTFSCEVSHDPNWEEINGLFDL